MRGGARRGEIRGIPPADLLGAAVHTPIGGTKIPPAAPSRWGVRRARRSFKRPASEGLGRFTGLGFQVDLSRVGNAPGCRGPGFRVPNAPERNASADRPPPTAQAPSGSRVARVPTGRRPTRSARRSSATIPAPTVTRARRGNYDHARRGRRDRDIDDDRGKRGGETAIV